MKAVCILMDSMNRRMLRAYNQDTFIQTPNLDRLARDSIVFDNHWAGSLPCMPARRELMTGRYNFLERNWGGIEPYDVTFPQLLRAQGVFCHMVTDHYHYFEIGGENYCQQYHTWDFHRGQEYDPWISRVAPAPLPDSYLGKVIDQYEKNRAHMKSEEQFSSPRTFAAACQWLEDNREADSFFLTVETFDPHEPFDCDERYLESYGDQYQGPRYDWAPYGPNEAGAEATEHLRNRYAATLSMSDRWLGKLLDTLEATGRFEDTLIICTTDHGIFVGERNFNGKNVMHCYNELAHLPLFIRLPGGKDAGRRVDALTQTADLMPTILDHYGVRCPEHIHGRSIQPLLRKEASSIREWALFGWHGKTVNITDGKMTYFRAPVPDNKPCYSYGIMPTTLWSYWDSRQAAEIECGPFLKHTEFPVLRYPADAYIPNIPGVVAAVGSASNGLERMRESFLFDIQQDYAQKSPIHREALEQEWLLKLSNAMKAVDAPREQWVRLGMESCLHG